MIKNMLNFHFVFMDERFTLWKHEEWLCVVLSLMNYFYLQLAYRSKLVRFWCVCVGVSLFMTNGTTLSNAFEMWTGINLLEIKKYRNIFIFIFLFLLVMGVCVLTREYTWGVGQLTCIVYSILWIKYIFLSWTACILLGYCLI